MLKNLSIAIFALAAAGAAHAETLAVPDAPAEAAVAAPAKLPAKGESMAVVSKVFGQPTVKHKAAGGDSRRHPPITRWDYDGFSVFFEHGTVIDAVTKDAPKSPVAHTEELKPAQ